MSSPPAAVAADEVQAQLAAMESALAAQASSLANQNMAADLLLKHKLTAGRSRNAKLLSEAVKQQDYQDHIKKVAASKQDEELKAKLAGGGRKMRGAAASNEPSTPSSAAPSVQPSPQPSPRSSDPEPSPRSGMMDAALSAVLAAEEARESAISSGLSAAEASVAQSRAATAALTEEQKNNDQFMKMLREMTDAEASKEQATARQLSSAEDALMKKLQKGKSTKQQKLIEAAFQNQSLVANFQGLEQTRQADNFAAKLAAGKAKKAAAAASAAAASASGSDSSAAAAAVPTAVDEALRILETLSEAKDEALADGKIRNESDAKAVEAATLTQALTEEQKNNETFMTMLRAMTEAEASKDQAAARQMSASDEAMLRKLQKGKTTKQQKLIEAAFQNSSFVENVQELQKQKQDEAMAAKIAEKKKKRKAELLRQAQAAEEEKEASEAAGGGAAAGGATTANMDEALKVLDTLATMKETALKSGTASAPGDDAAALASTLTEEQKNNDQFMTMLRAMTEAEASKDLANARQMSAADEAMLRKLQKGKSTKQQKLIEAAFQNSEFVENVQKASAKSQDDAMQAKLAAGKKKKAAAAAAKAAEEHKESGEVLSSEDAAQAALELEKLKRQKKAGGKLKAAVADAADSSAFLDTMVSALLHAEMARELAIKEGRKVTADEAAGAVNTAVTEHLTEEQQSAHTEFLSSIRANVDLALSVDNSAARVLGVEEEVLLRRLQQGKTLKMQKYLDRAFRVPASVQKLQELEQKRSDDAAIARLLQNKAAQKKEATAKQAAADSHAQFEAVLSSLIAIEELREKAAAEGRDTPAAADVKAAQTQAMEETMTADQRSNAELVAVVTKLSTEAASPPTSQPRILSAVDDALLKRLQASRPLPRAQAMLETIFHSEALVEQLQNLDAQRGTDAQVAKTLATKNKKKREAQAAEQAAEEAADAEAAEAAQAAAAAAAAAASKPSAADAAAVAAMESAAGVDGAKEFAAMLQQVSLHQAQQDMALSRQSEVQSEALMKKLLMGKSTKQKKLIEAAFAESGLVEAKVSQQAKSQDDAMQAKLAAGKKKKAAAAAAAAAQAGGENEEKYPSRHTGVTEPPLSSDAPVVDYLEQKYGEMLEAEEREADNRAAEERAAALSPAQAILENQEAIAVATTLGMNAGADGVAVAQIAAAAAALGLSPEAITAAASAAAQVAGMQGDNGEADHATFMELFRKATEDAAAEHMRRKAGQSKQDDDFMRRLLQGKKTKQQQMVEKQMADIMAANRKALSYQGQQDSEMARKLAAGKARRAGMQGPASEAVNRLAAEALASEMLLSHDNLSMSAGQQASVAAAQMAQEIAAIEAAPTILDELLAVSDAQSEEIFKQARETGISVAEIEAANSEALELDNMAAQLMLEKAREAEASGDAEGAAAFMDMYRRMVEEGVSKDNALKRQLSSAEEAMMRKLMAGKTTKQQKLIEKAFQNQSLVDAILNQEAARQQALFDAKLAQGKLKKKNEVLVRQAEEAFQKLRKIFLGAIKKLDAANIIRALDEALPLIEQGYLDLNRSIKEATGESMLHQAAKYGRAEVVEWLVLRGGARPNLGNGAAQTPLHFAALSLDPEGADNITPDNAATTCMVLIEGGGDVNAADASYDTPALIAERFGFDLSNLANTPQALEALALQRQRDEALAAQKLALQMQEEAAGAMQSETDSDEASKAASIAAQVAADAAAKLAAGVQVEALSAAASLHVDPSTGLPFTEAQVQLQKEELEMLMNEEKLEILQLAPPPSGALSDPKKIKQANLVFLQLCDLFKELASNPRVELEAAALIKANVELIREGYLDLSRPVKSKQDGSTLLHAAVFHQKINMVRQLLQNRADPNKTTIQGETPLHTAVGLIAEVHGKAIVSLLLEAGANPLLRDFKTGLSCFEHAPTKELRQWCEDWKPLAERQRLALANQMGGIDDLLNANAKAHRNAAFNAESSFLDKLMRGKLTKQGKLVDEAMRNNDSLEARTLTEQQRQLEAMQARLAKGKARKAGALGLTMEESSSLSTSLGPAHAARKKANFMEDMLLAELSEPTKDKIMLTAEKWADHPGGLNGLHIAVLSKLRGMPIAEALKLLATESAHAQQEQLRLNQAINAPGLDEQQALEYERQFNIADCNTDIYADLTNNMLEAEKKRADAERAAAGNAMSDEELAARERMDEIARKKEAARAALGWGGLPQEMREAIALLFSQYIALHTGYEVEPLLILQGALPLDDLASYQLDVETITTMLAATEIDPAKEFLQKQSHINEAVTANLQRLLADENLPQAQREEQELHLKLCASNGDLYENLMSVLLGLPLAAPAGAPMMMEEQSMELSRAQMEESAAKDAQKLVHPDTGLSVQLRMQDVVLDQMRELAAEFLGLEKTEMASMNPEQLQQALSKAGVNVDVLEELRKLTEAEAGKWLAKQMAKNEAESDMLKKLLNGKGLSAAKRAELLARQKALDDAAGLYNDLLSTLLTGEKKKYAQMSSEEQLAQDRMLAKLEARRRKQERQEVEARKKRAEEETAAAATMIWESSGGANSDVPEAEILEKAKQEAMHTLISENPQMLMSLQSLAAEHLGIAASEFVTLGSEAVSMLLAEKGVDINLLDYLKTLSNEEAAKHMAKEMARAEAEAKMLRKLLQGKGLTAAQREELLARQRQLDDNAKLYEDMLRDLLSAEQKKTAGMSAAERAAHEAMLRKLEQRKARELAKSKETQVDENSPLMDLFDDLAPKGDYQCRVCNNVNEAVNRACSFCRKSRADTLSLPEIVLWSAHRMLHQCTCPLSVIEVVHRAIGPCTKKNFLPFMQACTVACVRDEHVYWDCQGVDESHLGALGPQSAELVWGFNDWHSEKSYHAIKGAHLDPESGRYIGWTNFREECVQMPTIADYQ